MLLVRLTVVHPNEATELTPLTVLHPSEATDTP